MPFPSSQETERRHQTLCRSQTTSISFPIRALRIVAATPPLGTVRDIGHVAIPNPEMCHQWMEDRWNFSICAQKAHPACFQRMNSWDGNLLDLPSCLDLGLRQSASNFTGTLQRLDWSTADPKAAQKYHEVVVPRHWSTLSPKTSPWRLEGTFQRW